MSFHQREVENEQRISLAGEGFGLSQISQANKENQTQVHKVETCPTAKELEVSSAVNHMKHVLGFIAQKMTMEVTAC